MITNYGVSIIVPTFKQNKDFLEMAIASAINQTFWLNANSGSGEIIVIEDGLSDYDYFSNFTSIARNLNLEFIKSHNNDDDKNNIQIFSFSKNNREHIIKFILKENNGGTASALNTGIKYSSPEFKYFSWLSSDDFFYPDFLEMHFNAIENSQSRISYSGYSEMVYDKNGNLLSEQRYRPVILEDINYPYHMSKQLSIDRKDFKTSLSNDLYNGSCRYNGCCFVFEKSIFDEVGLFNEDYKFVQDFSMWLSISNDVNIKNIALLPQSLMSRREHKGRTQFLYSQEDFLKQKKWEMSDMFYKFIDVHMSNIIINNDNIINSNNTLKEK